MGGFTPLERLHSCKTAVCPISALVPVEILGDDIEELWQAESVLILATVVNRDFESRDVRLLVVFFEVGRDLLQ